MKKILLKLVFAFFLGSCLLPASSPAAQEQKIGASLQSELVMAGPGGKVPVIVRMKDPLSVQSLATPTRRKGAVRAQARANLIHALKARAEKSRQPLQKLLNRHGITKSRQLWLINGMALLATPAQIEEIARLAEVASIVADQTIELPRRIVPAQVTGTAEPNIDQVNAPALWDLGYAGQGVTVAIVDSGVDVSHPDLGPRWRGGSNSWYDSNGEYTDAPTDITGHGTEVAGLVLGGNSGGAYIGVAPEAQWIGVKIFDDADSASFSTIHLGFQWLFDPDGDPNTDDAPDIVNNSWGLEYAANSCVLEFQPDVQNLKAAGMAMVFSAGNTGLSGSVSPGNYPESFAVGSVDLSSEISTFSARGPSACDNEIYPEVVAPGDHVWTSSLDSTYVLAVGTSMAAPHASGVMALLLSAFPGIAVDTLETALKNSSTDLGTLGADNDYAYGLINSLAAYNYLSGLQGIAVTDSISPETDNQVAFGNVAPGGSKTASVRVQNTSSVDLTLGAADLSNIAEPFSVVSNTCLNQQILPAGETCSITLLFRPTVVNNFSGSLVILSNAVGEERVTMLVSGTAITAPDIGVSDTSISFGDVTEGVTADHTLIVSNDGNANLELGKIAFANLFSVFSVPKASDTCSGQILTQGTSCTLDVSFLPDGTSSYNDSIDIPSNDPDENPVTVAVSGTGLSAGTNNPPDTPQLVFPANGQQQLSTEVTFKWRSVTDPDGDPVNYDIYYCTSADPFTCNAVQLTTLRGQAIGGQTDGRIYYAGISYAAVLMFLGIAFAGRLRGRKKIALLIAVAIGIGTLLTACHPDDPATSDTTNETYAVPTGLNPATLYYWGVVAKDGQGGRTQSAVWSFTTL